MLKLKEKIMIPKIYLETSVFNYYFLDDPTRKEEMLDTKKLFDEIEKGEFEPFISGITIYEIEKCEEEEKREKMLDLIPKYNISSRNGNLIKLEL